MNVSRLFLAIFTLSVSVFAPQAKAMSLLPKARQVAAMVMKPGVRSSLGQAGNAGSQGLTSAIAPQAQRGLIMTPTQSRAQLPRVNANAPSNQLLNSTKGVQRGLSIGSKLPTTSMQPSVGLALAQTGNNSLGITPIQSRSFHASSAPLSDQELQNIIATGNVSALEEAVKENKDCADRCAKLVNAENFKNIDENLLIILLQRSVSAREKFTLYAIEHFETLIQRSSQGYNSVRRMLPGITLLGNIMFYNPKLAERFAECVLPHFGTLVHNDESCRFLKDIAFQHPEAAKKFLPCAVSHFDTLVQNEQGRTLLSNMTYLDSKAAESFLPCATSSIGKLVGNFGGACLLEEIMVKTPKAIDLFASYAAAHLGILIKHRPGAYFLSSIINNPPAKKQFLLRAGENFDAWVNDGHARQFLKNLVANYPETGEQFAPHLFPHLDRLVKKSGGCDFLSVLMKHDQKIAQWSTSYAADHFGALVNDEEWRFLKDIVTQNAEAGKKFTPRAVDHIDALVKDSAGISLLEDIMRSCKLESDVLPLIKSKIYPALWKHLPAVIVSWSSISGAVKEEIKARSSEILEDKHEKTLTRIAVDAISSENPTITQKYLVSTFNDMHSTTYDNLKRSKVADLVDEVVAFESQHEKDNYMFEHGKRWDYKLPEMVYRHFYQIAHNVTVPNDFMFTHTKKHLYSPQQKAAELEQETALHKQVINEPANIAGEVRNRRLFMNTGLLGNVDSPGSNSLYYVLKNYNQADARVSVKSIFEQFGLEALYEKHEAKCESLEKKAQALSEWGQLLVLGIPKEKISNLATYLCITGRGKRPVTVGEKETYDAKEILDARLEDPALEDNRINWVAAMTDNGLLDPRCGVKIKAVERPLDPAAFKAWEIEFNEFMRSISAEAKEIMDAHKKAAIEKDQKK